MNIGPSTEILRALRNQDLDWKSALGELIDNAFDARATTVQILFSPKNLTIIDDGDGCGDMESMLTMGKHVRQVGTKLGRYGVGLKDAALWLGGTVKISSVKGNQRHVVTVCWDELERSGSWQLPDPLVAPASPGERGTWITFHNHERSVPEGKAWTRLVEEIGYIFSPALRHGKNITMKPPTRTGVPASAPRFELPPLIEHIDQSVIVSGKRVRVHVGIVGEGVPNPRPGITYCHGFRVILPSTSFGCGDEFSCARISGWVTLDEGWRLTRNKDGISAQRDELGAAVYGACRPIIEKAAGQAWVVQSSKLANELTAALRERLRAQINSKAKRRKGTEEGTHPTRGTTRRHRNARELQPGQKIMSTLRAGSIRIDWAPMGQETIGIVDTAGSTVRLSSDHPSIMRAMKEDDRRWIFLLVYSLLVNHEIVSDGGQLRLSLEDVAGDQKFGSGLAALLLDSTGKESDPPVRITMTQP